MISEVHWKILDEANRQLVSHFDKLRKTRIGRDPNGIQNAEIDYLQALQCLYAAVEDAVNAQNFRARGNPTDKADGTEPQKTA